MCRFVKQRRLGLCVVRWIEKRKNRRAVIIGQIKPGGDADVDPLRHLGSQPLIVLVARPIVIDVKLLRRHFVSRAVPFEELFQLIGRIEKAGEHLKKETMVML